MVNNTFILYRALSQEEFDAVQLVLNEYINAVVKFGPFHSPHEGYGILFEEVDELWDEVKLKDSERQPDKMALEARQVSAVGLRFLVEIISKNKRFV